MSQNEDTKSSEIKPFLDHSTRDFNSVNSLYSGDSDSDGNLLLEAPIARQPRCSIDIETILPMSRTQRKHGIVEESNAYLDNLQLRDSIQEIL